MGTELLDIHFRIEKRFGVALPVDEVLSFTTVGDIADAIAARVSAARRQKCVTLPAFLETRRFVREFKNEPTLPIRPTTLIASLIPVRQRMAFWSEMRKWYGSPPPSLRLSTVWCAAYFVLMLAAGYLAVFYGYYGMVAAWCLVAAMVAAKRRLPHVPPAKFTTVWEIALRRASVETSIASDAQQVDSFAALQQELSCALGVDASELHRETRLKEDLDVG
jgi:hypothetical protein